MSPEDALSNSNTSHYGALEYPADPEAMKTTLGVAE